jgi:hypothetical protein
MSTEGAEQLLSLLQFIIAINQKYDSSLIPNCAF